MASNTTILNTLSAVVVFFTVIINKGYCQCSLNDIKVSESQTGKQVQNKQEWQVTISNGCICTQTNLKVSCDGFQTVERVDPSVLAQPAGDECLVNSGNPVTQSSPVIFTYAWDTSFSFKPLSSQISCS